MKLTYIGDAHDHWKGSLFQYLQEGEILRNFLVDPMATDGSPWNAANSKLYAHLLRIEESQLVQHDRTLFQEPSPWWPVRLIRKLALISSSESRASKRPVALLVARNSMQSINQSFRVSKIGRTEPLCEPAVDWFDNGNRFSATALIAQQAGEARRGSQLP